MIHFLDYFSVSTAYAATATATFVGKVNRYVTNPLIVLLFAAALVYFLYGMLQFIINAGDATERQAWRNHMLWGIVGMLIMFAVFTILHLLLNTLGLTADPNLPVQ